jgi:hypothetical protein
VDAAIRLLHGTGTRAVELSALRVHELRPLLDAVPRLDLRPFECVSVHAPSAFTAEEEPGIAAALAEVAARGWRVIVHPDTLHDFGLWKGFGRMLCVENMDRRKPVGRTARELEAVFDRLPDASFCFDIAHARQCDTSMCEAYAMLRAFGSRLAEVHVSELDPASRHVRLSPSAVHAFSEVAGLIPPGVPVIIEAPVRPDELADEVAASLEALGRAPACIG